jgi:hypothetical protein
MDSCAKPLPSFRFQVTPLFERSLQVAASPCCVKVLPNAISVVLPYVPGPLLQLLPRCCLPFLPLGHWPSPSEHGSALGFAPPLLLRMVKILELQSFHYVPARRFARLTGSSYPHTSQCRAAETFPAAHITVGCLPRAAAMLSTQTGQLVVRGLAPLKSDRLVGYSVRKASPTDEPPLGLPLQARFHRLKPLTEMCRRRSGLQEICEAGKRAESYTHPHDF